MERLQKKQAALRQAIEKIIAAARDLLQSPTIQVGELEEHLDLILEQADELKSVNESIEKKIDLQELDAELEACAAYTEKICSIKTKIKRALRSQTANESRSTTPSVTGNASEQEAYHIGSVPPATFQPVSATTKLPKLEIGKFSGDLRSWQKFWNQFESTIHKNSTLPAIAKFQYLTSYLTGKAAAAIEGLPISDRNYDIAVKTLIERFGKEDVIIEDHMSRLLDVRPVHDLRDIERLRSLYDEIRSGVRSLEALGVSSSTYGTLLLTVLRKSIPSELCLAYFRRKAASPETPQHELLSFLDFMREEVESRERAQSALRRGYQDAAIRQKAPIKGDVRLQNPSASVLTVTDGETQCAFCGAEGHQPANCVAPVPMAKKKEVMSRERRCYKCAKKKHRAAECRTARWLKCAKCSGLHATGVCELNQRPTHPPSIGDAAPAETAVQSSLQVGPALGKTRVLLQTARAYAEGQHNSALVRMLLDGGSQRTFVRQDVSRRLNLRVIGGEKLAIYAFGSERPSEERRCHRVECWLRNWRNNTRVRIEALEVPEICGDLLPPPDDSTASIAREQDLQLADTLPDGYNPGVGVELLIGADHYWDIATGNVKRLGEKLVAMETAFGWTLQGTESTSSVATFLSSTGVMRVGVTTAPDEISRQLRSFWELEHLGIVNDTQLTAKEDSVLRAFEETITQKNGRYQVALPWKENASDLTDNTSIASHRLHSLTAKLLRHEETVLDYDQAIRNYLQAGHAEEANELGESPLGPIYYMPHRGVVRPGSETTKLRVVFDASSKAAGKLSLNDVLFAGPNLNPNLADILIRFRVHNVAIMSDIEKAFLQIELAESARDAVRFLWYQSTPGQGDALPPIKEYRMTRVPFGVTCSPFLLAATLSHHLKTVQEKFPRTAKILSDNLYVDDLVTGADSVEEAERIIRESQSILKAAGMNLRKWRSNYPELIASFAETESAQKTLPELGPTKILGVEWRPDTDEFVFEMTALIGFLASRQDTKRFVLQASARIFDPFGFLSAITITAKIMFQSLWERGTAWDERVPSDLQETWDKWCLPVLTMVAGNEPALIAGEDVESRNEHHTLLHPWLGDRRHKGKREPANGREAPHCSTCRPAHLPTT
ncbi:uncharacterized protein LOC142571494 [Dermacentor variabilis]|uniref:uncharacterized protein LOC142571494 n=1 Tax=Dermacentor variabilis TaxID=34621 RepID=UPI003F5CA9D3